MVRIDKAHLERLQSPFSLPRGSFVVANGDFYFFWGVGGWEGGANLQQISKSSSSSQF